MIPAKALTESGQHLRTQIPMAIPSDENLTKADYESLAEFRYALRKFLSFSEEAAAEHGVSPQQYQALLAIEGFPCRNWVTIGELAEQMRIAHHSAVGLVDRMETLKLVKRSPSGEDRRRVQVALTAKGRKLLEKLYLIHRAELRSSGARLAALLQKSAARIPPKIVVTSPPCAMPEIED
jgi:DNA-binding MarR family transcriptional regulator